MPRPSPSRAPQGLWFCNWHLWQGAKQLLAAALAPLELTPRDFWLLALVEQAPSPQHELAAQCGVDPSSLVAVLDELQARGWIERRRHPSDRRVHLVALTAPGAQLYRRALPLARRAEAEQLQALEPEERRRLLQLLRKLVHV